MCHVDEQVYTSLPRPPSPLPGFGRWEGNDGVIYRITSRKLSRQFVSYVVCIKSIVKQLNLIIVKVIYSVTITITSICNAIVVKALGLRALSFHYVCENKYFNNSV